MCERYVDYWFVRSNSTCYDCMFDKCAGISDYDRKRYNKAINYLSLASSNPHAGPWIVFGAGLASVNGFYLKTQRSRASVIINAPRKKRIGASLSVSTGTATKKMIESDI